MDLVTAYEIEKSDFFLAIVTRHWIAEPWHRDEIAYAKALGKPFALAIEKGVDPSNWFDDCNVIGKIRFDMDNYDAKEIDHWLGTLRDFLIRKKEINSK